ncbi:MAG TPA: CHASE2 domain-containing protein, partial [Ramlibacter sp.]|nr:CHASE2 domain-containing protein [Ramlibacter sp.]
ERKAYDMGVQASSRTPSDRVAVIAIDDESIANIGRWPWPRDVHAKMIDLLAAAKAKVIGYTVFFSEPQLDPGYRYIAQLLEMARKAAPGTPEGDAMAPLVSVLTQAEASLNTDRKLAESFARAGNVLLPMLFTLGQPRGRPDQPLPDFVQKNVCPRVGGDQGFALPTESVQIPVPAIGRAAAGLGHLNAYPDVDGAIRTEPLVLQYFDQYYPSLSMLIAAKSLNLGPADISVRLGEGVSLGNLKIGTDPAMQMHTYFYKDRDGRPAFQVDSFYDVLSGKIPASKYADKIVLIGPTAAGIGTTSVTPIAPAMAPVLTLAHAVSSILQQDFFVSPTWAWAASKAVFLAIALYLIVLLPRLKAGLAAALTAVLLAALLAAHFGLMTTRGVWMPLMVPATLLLLGHLAL